ncbi:MAG TPA: hypothetical protein VIW24_08540 [Aldersonia sp.]
MQRKELGLLRKSAPVEMPQEWVDMPPPPLKTVSDCAIALRAGQWATFNSSTWSHTPALANFAERFWEQLRGPTAHVVIEYSHDISSLHAVTLTSAWMGLSPRSVHNDLGGTVSHVVSGVGHRHDQSWHTDSTPWTVPNRYSILGFLAGESDARQSTDLLPIGTLKPLLANDPTALSALRNEHIPWRRNFPDLNALDAPVLGKTIPRWVWPVLEPLLGDFSANLRRGVLALAEFANSTAHYAPVVAPGRVLVFDNRRALHRAPHLEAKSGRELIRIKIGGGALS